MKIAVTGANGFVGSNLANYFHSLGNEVIAIVRPQADTSLLNPCLTIIPVDYNSASELDSAFQGVEILIHNAGKTRTKTFAEMISANVGITRKVLEAINRSADCRRFIYISSQSASRPSRRGEEICEEDRSAPVNWYGRSKVLAERIIKAECAKAWTIVRPASIYGAGERDFLNVFRMIKAGVNFHIGRRDRHFSMIHIDELCEFIGLCVVKDEAANELFFASDGEIYLQSQFTALAANLLEVKALKLSVPVDIAKLVFHAGDLFERITGKTTLINTQKLNDLLVKSWVCSNDKARRLLGWAPHADLEANLRLTFKWYREKGWL